jgi:hypothetical protein
VVVQGHGVRERQQRGPATTLGPAACAVVAVRRYRCTACDAVMTVLPATAQAFRHFSGAAIAMAMALWGLGGESARRVRERVNDARPGPGARGWRSLARWAGAAAEGRLFAGLQLQGATGTPRERAARVAQALCGHAPPAARQGPVHDQAFVGAAHVA